MQLIKRFTTNKHRRWLMLAFCSVALIGLELKPIKAAQAQQTIIVNQQFDSVRQGTFGVVSISGDGVSGGTANALGHAYPFFAVSKGFATLLSVPIETKLGTYSLAITINLGDRSSATCDGNFKVISGEFVTEPPFILPIDKVYLLSDTIQASEDPPLKATYVVVTRQR